MTADTETLILIGARVKKNYYQCIFVHVVNTYNESINNKVTIVTNCN